MATPAHLETLPLVHWASYRGDVQVLEQLYGGGWSLTARDSDGRTPLHCAALNGQLETVKWLVQKNSDLLCMQDSDGGTPLHWAAAMGHLEAVKWQVERRGDLLCMQDKDGLTPLDCAVLLAATRWRGGWSRRAAVQ